MMPDKTNTRPATIAGNTLGAHTVMVSRPGVLGDIILAIPVVYSVCRSYPDVKFVMLTADRFSRVFVGKPDNLIIETRDFATEYRGAVSRYRLAAELMRTHGYDIYIDLQNDSSTRMMRLYCRLHGVKTITFNRDYSHCRSLTRRSNKVMLPMTSARARYLATFFTAGFPSNNEFNGLYGNGLKADPALMAQLTPPKRPGEKWIGVAPFAAYPSKEYPLDKMEEVIKTLASRRDTVIFIFGDKGREADVAARWQQNIPNVTSLAGGRHDFASELALMSHLDVMLTMDSANMHMAAISGAPTISIWGATHHYCGFRGWHQLEKDMVQLPLPCRPCSITGDKPCYRHDHLCLTALRQETIITKVEEKLR